MTALLLSGCAPQTDSSSLPPSSAPSSIVPEASAPASALAPGESSAVEASASSRHEIAGFEVLLQSPELPTGCEITAMTMALRYAGLDADKVTMATEYLPCQPYKLYTGADGKTYGPDWNHYFIGDPTTEIRYVCGTGAILTAANRYLEDVGNPLRAKDRTGARPEELYALVSQDIPVVVWVTIRMGDRTPAGGWYTEEGEYLDWSKIDHAAVLIGYTEDEIVVADPITGRSAYPRSRFERIFASRNNRCVILEEAA